MYDTAGDEQFWGREHYSYLSGDGFLNVGIERVFSIEPAKADVSVSFWYDFNGKDQNLFTHNFNQVGVTGQLKKEHWDFILNGYILGGPAGGTVPGGSLKKLKELLESSRITHNAMPD